MTLALIRKTNAIAPLAKAVADFFIDSGGLGGRVAILPDAPDLAVKTYSVVTRQDRDLSPAAEALLATLLKRCRSRRDRGRVRLLSARTAGERV